MDRVAGKVAIVTGGASGIGRSTCILLANEGAKVALVDIQKEAGCEVAREINNQGGTAEFWHLDVSHEKEVAVVFAEIKQRFGTINVLVNSAGISELRKPTTEMSEEDMDNMLSINFKGTFFCNKHAVPYMKEAGGGSVINVGSIYGLTGSPNSLSYHASKGAIRLMTKGDAIYYARDNIRFNCVHPGFVWTPMIEKLLAAQGNVEEKIRYLDRMHPVGHMGEAKDIAYGIVYLASDESKFVTGIDLPIDGGFTAQ